MSLINLSRSTPRVRCKPSKSVSAEMFIQDALHYASGVVLPVCHEAEKHRTNSHFTPMRRATFTLTEECIDQLQQLSEHNGVAKSKLIRLWIQRYASRNND